jgi:hypothetical protein
MVENSESSPAAPVPDDVPTDDRPAMVADGQASDTGTAAARQAETGWAFPGISKHILKDLINFKQRKAVEKYIRSGERDITFGELFPSSSDSQTRT